MESAGCTQSDGRNPGERRPQPFLLSDHEVRRPYGLRDPSG